MYTLQETLRPLVEKYNEWLNGSYMSGLLQFKGQNQIGSDYISKVYRARSQEITGKYSNAVMEVQNPSFKNFLYDNIVRLAAFNCVERLIVAYQAAPSLGRLNRPNSLSFLFTEIMNDGAFRGTLRGLTLSLAQTSLVLWPSVLLTNRTNGGGAQFVGTYLALDALLYPLDTIKNIMYAHTAVPRNIRQSFSDVGLYRGFLFRLAFNVPFAGALYTTATGCDTSWAFWLATIAAYPLNTLKVINQTATTTNNLRLGGLYRGVVPFAILNILFTWQLTALFTPEKLHKIGEEALIERHQKLGF